MTPKIIRIFLAALGVAGCVSADAPANTDRPRAEAAISAHRASGFEQVSEKLDMGGLGGLCRNAIAADYHPEGSKGPHEGYAMVVFMNDLARQRLEKGEGAYPVGSVIIKEKFSAWASPADIGRELQAAIGGMIKREPGYDTRFGDWEYFYIERTSPLAAGRLTNCRGCHNGAAGRDHVFGGWRPTQGEREAAEAQVRAWREEALKAAERDRLLNR